MASEYVWIVAGKMGELIQSDSFDCDAVRKRELSLSQAFCLLWQNQETGDVAGRQKPGAMTNMATAAVLLDLYVLGKIDLHLEIKHWMEKKRQIILVKVKDDTLTESYLDKALFSDILTYAQRTSGRNKTAVEWIVQGSCEKENSPTVVLDSLVRLGILGRQSRLFGRRYPTLNPDPERKLVDEIRKVVLLEEQADGFIWTLLKLIYEVDCCFGQKGKLLQRYFLPAEFDTAREKIGTLITVDVEVRQDTEQNIDSFELQVV